MSVDINKFFDYRLIDSTEQADNVQGDKGITQNKEINKLTKSIIKKLDSRLYLGNFFNGLHNRIANKRDTSREKKLMQVFNNMSITSDDHNKVFSVSGFKEMESIDGLSKSVQKLYDKVLDKNFKYLWENKDTKPLGSGSFGTVYGAKDENGKEYVIKAFNPDVTQESIDEEIAGNKALFVGTKQFESDDQAFYKQGVGFLTKFCGKYEIDGKQVVVYEKAPGKDFDKILAEKPCTKENVKDRCAILVQMGNAIAISHEAGVVNRDIKPQNLMVYESNDSENLINAKLIDLGTACDLKKTKENNAKQIGVGSPLYMAPEIIKSNNKSKVDVGKIGVAPATDVYSFGISIIQCIIGEGDNTFWKEQVNCGFTWDVLDAREESILFNNLFQENFLRDQRDAGKIPNFYTDEQCDFLQGLLRDCLNPDPAERPSAAQVAELLQLFSSSLGGNGGNGNIMSYSDAKKIVEKDRPKAIPIAIRDMIFSEDEAISKQGLAALDALAKADPSYINTPSYGLVTRKYYGETYDTWEQENPEAAKNLKDWTYLKGGEATGDQTISLTQSAYDDIHFEYK